MNRQAIAFGKARHQNGLGIVHQALQAGRRQPRDRNDVVAQGRASLEEIDDQLVFPAARPDEHQFWGRGAVPAHEIAPCREDHQVVLARLYGAAQNEVGVSFEGRIDLAGLGKDRRDGGRRHEDRDVGAPQGADVGLEVVGDRLRGHQSGRAKSREVCHPLAVALEFRRAEIFRHADRQQIMNEESRLDIRPRLQPLERAGNPKRELAGVDIDAAFRQIRLRRLHDGQAMAAKPAHRAQAVGLQGRGPMVCFRRCLGCGRSTRAGQASHDRAIDRIVAAGRRLTPVRGYAVDRVACGCLIEQARP